MDSYISRAIKSASFLALFFGMVISLIGFASTASAQEDNAAQCVSSIMNNGLQWDGSNAKATEWVLENAENLCRNTPAVDYPIACFSAAIKKGAPWSEAIKACTYNFESCVYQSASQDGLRFANNSVNGYDFGASVGFCLFGEEQQTDLTARKVSGKCSQAGHQAALNQNEIADVCLSEVAVFAEEPIRCYQAMAGEPVFRGNYSAEQVKADALALCRKSVNLDVTKSCFFQGVVLGFNKDDIFSVCSYDDATAASVSGIEENHNTWGAVAAMRQSCIRNNAVDKTGKVDMANAWVTCMGQPLF